jgi:anti-anti-sigma factor
VGERELRIESEERGEGARIALFGRLTAPMVDDVEAELANVEERGLKHVVLDLRGLTSIDEAGVRTVLAADARSRQDGFNFAVVRGPTQVHRVFVLTPLGRHLVMVDDPEDLAPPT